MLDELLGNALNADTLRQLSQAIGADEQTTGTAVASALPMLLNGLAHNASTPEGADALHNALANDHDGSILDNLNNLANTLNTGAGAGILGHIFGGQQQNAAANVSQASGLDLGKAMSLLTMLAPLVMGILGRTRQQQGLDSGGIADILQQTVSGGSGGGLGSLLGGLLDRNRDGNTIDDVLKMAGSLFQRRG